MKKLKNKEVAGQMGHFDRLPNELVLSILSRIDDLKLLCKCSLVSKRFASTIYCIRTVSLILPSFYMNDIDSPEAQAPICKLFNDILCYNVEEIPRLIKSSTLQKLNFCIFLQNFRELESIYIEFPCPKSPCISPFLKWKARCRSRGAMIESLVFILPYSMHKKTQHESDEDQEDEETPTECLETQFNDCQSLPLSCCREWLPILCLLIKCHNSLQNVTITDSHKHGKLVVRHEQLVEWRNSLLCKEFLNNVSPDFSRISLVPELHLPISGYMMHGVLFMYTEFQGESHGGDLITYDYDDEEMVVVESVREILKNHRDWIYWTMNPW
ncbi:hypothetical protein ACJIZ3_017484 [Penstemon smallii]|uniref:F-box domain-containing protein n=1 Tax=Penstemon smallii TaxID=265156 RepID=A0ABD3SWY7_9LAMI